MLFKKLTVFIIAVFFTIISQYSWAISGKVKNNKGEVVPNASIIFQNESDTTIKYYAVTDAYGHYNISLPTNNVESFRGFEIFNNYPNPFANGTVLPFILNDGGNVTIIITNYLGQEVAVVFDGFLPAGFHQIIWNRFQQGHKLSQGIYFYTLFYNGYSQSKKMLIYGSENSIGTPTPVDILNINNSEIKYNIIVSAELHYKLILKSVDLCCLLEKDFTLIKYSPVPYATVGNYIGIDDGNGAYNPIFVNGINFGVTLPGKLPGEMDVSKNQYRDWINKIGDMGFNSIRVYTLHFPWFYDELAQYNNEHPDKPLYLFQGIWLDEEGPNGNLFSYLQQFNLDIEEVTDCVHGNRFIPERQGRAYGSYTTDISPWVMAFIIGREVQPWEVFKTDSLNLSQTSFNGVSVSIDQSSPSAVFFTRSIDHLITYERNTYSVQRPVSQSSWPTLDPIEHPSEQFDSSEDTASIDMEGIILHNAPAGYFASYHAYPYFPDFINEQLNYATYSDEYGANSYVGYLTDLKSHYHQMPLIIAEYGVPSSWGNAHFAQSGMNHGGHDEETQGHNNIRLMKNIYNTSCGGGFIFGWIDEWFKACWITDPIGSSLDRRPMWHNITSAEENFGLLSFDASPPLYNTWPSTNTSCFFSQIKADHDNQFFYLKLFTQAPFNTNDTAWIAFDTYRNDLGESVLPNGITVNNRAEFALKITLDSANLYVTQAYDLFGIWHKTSVPEQLYHSIISDGLPWNLVRWKNNHWDDAIDKIGILKINHLGESITSKDAVFFHNDYIEIRIPWTLLQFTDPSLREVMDDDRSTLVRETSISNGIAVTVSIDNCFIETPRFSWNTWNEAPSTIEREKASFDIIKQALHTLDFTPY